MSKKKKNRSDRQQQPASRRGKRWRGKEDVLWALGLTLLAWAHRLFFLHSNRDRAWPFTIFYEGDARPFFLHARALLAGELYDQGIPFHPPGFPYFLAGLHSLFGAGAVGAEVPHLAVKSVLALVSSLSVGLLYLLVRPYVGRAVALVASLLCAWHFGSMVLAVAPVSEGLFLTLLLAALLVYTRRLEHPFTAPGAAPAAGRAAFPPALGLGLLFGLLALVRVESALFGMSLGAVGLGAWARGWWRDGRPRERLADGASWLLVAVGFWLALVPSLLHNHARLVDYNQRMGDALAEPLPTWVPVTIYGPVNLALANREGAAGFFDPAPLTAGTGGALDFTHDAHLEWILHGDRMAREWILENPGDFARLVARKWALFFDALDLGFTQWNWPGGLVGERRPVDVFVPDRQGLSLVLGGLLLFGWILAVASGSGAESNGPRRLALLAGLSTAVALGTTAFFFGYARQGLLQWPLWSTFVAYALVAAGRFVVDRRLEPPAELPKLARRVLFAVALVFFFLEAWGAGADRNYRASASSTIDGRLLNPDDTVRLEVLPREK